ncbi:glycosyltransferase family 4 protein [Haloarcula salinisoli]|uniref:Glycosyltransferase family 4 protein n=1 Tax=Haloarcula salinisoli TaxID=2487746 RepID=A0A8J8C6A9_9EURY|nr:glycosyltransferase family 4 protein [Halomicroarcula salinisoli]MBX0286459.1 glycosyltransferase family 4 protein [Halomicroarcula salinisoli]MBX0302052.1 glycosyltransferase family 4 protein [Halomicroarcula salinisoli]
MRGLNVLLINDSAEIVGGVEYVMQEEMTYLSNQGYTVRSIGLGTVESGDSFTDTTIPESDSRVVREVAGLTIEPKIYSRLRTEIGDFDPDVVHIHKSQKYPATIALATRGYPSIKTHHDYSTVCPSAWGVKQDTLEVCECGVGAKCWQHGCRTLPVVVGYYLPQQRVQRSMERRLIDKHIAPGQTLTDYLNDFGYDASRVPNPQPSENTDGNTADDGYFVFLGRLAEEKGVEKLIQAAVEIAADSNDIDIRIAGTGPLEEQLIEQAEQQCPESVEFLGYVSEEKKHELFTHARAVIVPSIWMEAFGMVVLEAMQCGTPVIGSDRGGIGELVQDGSTGLVYPATDSSMLAAQIRKLHTDPELAGDLGKRAQEWVCRNYSYEALGPVLESQLHAAVS